MLLWFIFALLTAGVVGILLRASRASTVQDMASEAGRTSADVAVYKDQLSELDADLARGLIGEAEARAARTEVSRRLLASAAASDGEGEARAQAMRAVNSRVVTVAGVAVPLAALAIYLGVGSPGLPDQPHVARMEAAAVARSADAALAQIESHLRQSPDDGRGWDVIAPIYLGLNRFPQAAEAYANANRLLGETPQRLAGFAQSEILANNGIVNPPARAAAERLKSLDPARLDARMWLTLAQEQDGALNEALTGYRALREDPKASPAMRDILTQRIDIVEERITNEAKGKIEDKGEDKGQ